MERAEPRLSTAVTREDHFEALFASYYRRLARLLYRLTGDTGRAEEAAAEAFWRLYQATLPQDANVEGWLYRTGVRLALDRLKTDRRRGHYEALSDPPDSFRTPEQVTAQRDQADRVRATLAALKREQAALIVLRSDGASYAELAAVLDLNPHSVGTALARAEAAFRKEYAHRYGELSAD